MSGETAPDNTFLPIAWTFFPNRWNFAACSVPVGQHGKMADYRALRDEANAQELVTCIERAVPQDGFTEPFPGIRLTRMGSTTEQVFGDAKPAVCFIAQGAKEVHIGGSCLRYDPDHYMLATVELPVRGIVHDATPARPYLGLRVELDPALVGSVMLESGIGPIHNPPDSRAICVSAMDAELRDAAARLVRLLDSERDARLLIPQIKREIVYRILMGSEGHRLRYLPISGGYTQRIAQVLEKLRREFDQPLRIEALAREFGMSSTRFHHHFKAVTEMSPLQFQKQIRLQEARRLMLGDGLDASAAGYQVGYEDPSHFSRDYKRYFGEAPIRDVERLRLATG